MARKQARTSDDTAPRRRRWWHISGVSHATVVAYLAVFMAMSGTAVAATGGTFILGNSTGFARLGTSNTNTARTTLANPNGVPLRLTPKAGSAPMTVDSTTQVAKLNADLLDGKDSTAFVAKKDYDALTARVTQLEELLASVSLETVDGQPTDGSTTAGGCRRSSSPPPLFPGAPTTVGAPEKRHAASAASANSTKAS